ncbi:Hypothetical protein GbCGDNIH1_1204 [Granulibacter bethesdensis CGDNIH1]|uniref:DUF4340 domain-containing protein n=2 Tax=Granulibacter bethesdensis TaxID=364410 RepID=Q0BSV0_GRABC|nr:Hypothetical protein GbCGDNIH1_1204 [Granulibacter bethesdensis CGDNIH1]APH51927.1 Hypothetical protein GbCGDNIH5_1204 [Granulibacter bethesdensis]APH64617.1 Hypothetical protein GbCGDNIH1I4_1204 [Granulibacter bethesdensis]
MPLRWGLPPSAASGVRGHADEDKLFHVPALPSPETTVYSEERAMTPRSSLFLAGAAVLALAGGWYFGPHAVSLTAVAVHQGEAAFPALMDKNRLDSIQTITISQFGQSMTLVKTPDHGWTVPQLGGYVARPAKIRGLLNTLVSLRLTEPRTNHPAEYPLLGVATPDPAKPAKSDATVIRLQDGKGDLVGELIIGHRQSAGDIEGVVQQTDSTNAPATTRGTYIRRHGDDYVWLTKDALEFSNDPQDWVDPVIISINAARLDRVHITRPDSAHEPVLTLSRKGDMFRLTEPADAPRTDSHAVADTLQALSDLEFTHIKPAAAISGVTEAQSVFETQDGLTVIVNQIKVGDETWLTFSAKAAPGSEAIANTMNKAVGPWAFQVQDYKERALFPTLQLLKSVEHVPSGAAGESEIPTTMPLPNIGPRAVPPVSGGP